MATKVKVTVPATSEETAEGHIDALLDELKGRIAEKLDDEQRAGFLAGRLALMVTMRMRVAGRIPRSEVATWTCDRDKGQEGGE